MTLLDAIRRPFNNAHWADDDGSDYEINHYVCDCNPDKAVCGADVSSMEWGDMGDPCVVCHHPEFVHCPVCHEEF